jgi:hypothetical protein
MFFVWDCFSLYRCSFNRNGATQLAQSFKIKTILKRKTVGKQNTAKHNRGKRKSYLGVGSFCKRCDRRRNYGGDLDLYLPKKEMMMT